MLKSKKEESKNFSRWVTREVLPSIRKTGTYSITNYNNENLSLILQKQLTIIEQKDKQLERLIVVNERKDIEISKMIESNSKLVDKILNDRPKKAVFPENLSTRFIIQVYQHKNHQDFFRFIRTQKRSLNSALSKFKLFDYNKIWEKEDVPAGVPILVRLKEIFKQREIYYKVPFKQPNVIEVKIYDISKFIIEILQEAAN